MSLKRVKSIVEENGIEFLLVTFVEMTGASKAKVIPITHLDLAAEEGAGFAGFAAGSMGQGPHNSEIISIPDFNSATIVPWRPNMIWVAGNIHVEGQPYDYCPRTILSRQIEKAAEKGYLLNVGVEPEFMLLKKQEDGSVQPYDDLDTLIKPCYDLLTLNRNFDFMTTLMKYVQDMGWSPFANDHEDANCQFEINYEYADPLTTSDRHTFFKWMTRSLAESYGLLATFMPKPISDQTGNGGHYHMSLWDKDNQANLFLDEENENGISQMGYWFIGGLLEHAGALSAVAAPIVNSYKRLVRGAPRSGATWAPVYVTYGGSNRTQMVRIPGPGRIENRTVDGAANPYLAMAVMLAAGMDGIENKLDPGERNDENLYEVPAEELTRRGIDFLPAELPEALDSLQEDDVIKEALGTTYADYYISVKREEWRQYHNTVAQWELDAYLPIY